MENNMIKILILIKKKNFNFFFSSTKISNFNCDPIFTSEYSSINKFKTYPSDLELESFFLPRMLSTT